MIVCWVGALRNRRFQSRSLTVARRAHDIWLAAQQAPR